MYPINYRLERNICCIKIINVYVFFDYEWRINFLSIEHFHSSRNCVIDLFLFTIYYSFDRVRFLFVCRAKREVLKMHLQFEPVIKPVMESLDQELKPVLNGFSFNVLKIFAPMSKFKSIFYFKTTRIPSFNLYNFEIG